MEKLAKQALGGRNTGKELPSGDCGARATVQWFAKQGLTRSQIQRKTGLTDGFVRPRMPHSSPQTKLRQGAEADYLEEDRAGS